MKKVVGVVLVLMLLLITLSGCMKVDYNAKVNSDGSVDITYTYAVKKSFIEEMKQMGENNETESFSSDNITEEVENETAKNGYTVEKFETDELVGIKAMKKIEDASQMDLKEVFSDGLTQSENGGIIVKKGIVNKYSQNLTVNLGEEQDFSSYGVEANYSVTLPAKASSSNADSVSSDGKTLTWNLAGGGEKIIEFTATQISIIPILIAAIVIIAIIAIVVILIVKSKKKVKE